jgi:preprotein translocase subunit SecE
VHETAALSTATDIWKQEGRIVTETRAQRSSSEGRPGDRGGRTGLSLFLRQVIAELRKVIWPTRDQLTTYFLVVLVFVLFMIAFVSVFDFLFNKAAFAVFG